MKRKITILTKVMLIAIMAMTGQAVFSQTNLLEEIFLIGSGELDSDSTNLSAMPDGWIINYGYASSKNNYDLSDTDASVCIMFKSNDSYLITPAVNNPGTLTFWAKYKDPITGAVLKLEKSVDGGEYVEIESISTLGADYAEFTSVINDPSDNVKIKFSSVSGSLEEYKFYVDYVVLTEGEVNGTASLSSDKNFKILNNYVQDILNFESDSQLGNLTVIDINGRVVLKSIYDGNTSLNVSNLNSGLYFLVNTTKSGKYIEKFVKQ